MVRLFRIVRRDAPPFIVALPDGLPPPVADISWREDATSDLRRLVRLERRMEAGSVRDSLRASCYIVSLYNLIRTKRIFKREGEENRGKINYTAV